MNVPPFWSLKPWWCQPWSILLTGVLAVSLSWWAVHLWWITLPVAALVLLWWGLFLVLVPASYRSSSGFDAGTTDSSEG
jgi:hypothetical protein